MSANLDKDTLIKYHFWILAGIFLVVILVPLGMLLFSVGSEVAGQEEALFKEKDTIKKISNPKNGKWADELKKKDDTIQGNKDKVWADAWKTQEGLMTWPETLEKKGWGKTKYTYFGDKIAPYDGDRYAEEYKKQLWPIVALVDPLKDTGFGAVQFAGGIGWEAWNNVLRIYHGDLKGPSTADIWLLQEDLLVTRELLRVIRDTNEGFARFKDVTDEAADKEKKDAKAKEKTKTEASAAPNEKAKTTGAEKSKAGTKAGPRPRVVLQNEAFPVKRFRNPYWELELKLETKGQDFFVRGKLTNISKRRQPVDVGFKIYFEKNDDTAFDLLPVAAEPLDTGKSLTIASTKMPKARSLAVAGIYGVEQALTWKSAPVKRIDRVELGYLSSRNSLKFAALKPPKFIKDEQDNEKKESEAAAAAGGTGDTAGGPSGDQRLPGMPGGPGGMGEMMKKSGMMMGGGSAGMDGSTTKSGLQVNRYLDYTDTARFMPVGMLVIIDEDFIPEFLAAFANAKLRIQTTQYHWAHFRDKIDPQLPDENSQPTDTIAQNRGFQPERGGVPTGMPRGGRSGKGGGMMGGMMPGTMPGGSMMGMRNPMENYMKQMRGQGQGMMRGGAGGPSGDERAGGIQMRGGSFRGFLSGGMGGMMGAGQESVEEADEMNLVELSVYGIATLYERFPPKPKPAETPAPTTTGTDTASASGATPPAK